MSCQCLVSQCCCGCSLRCGSLTSGILCLVLSVVNTAFNLFYYVSFDGYEGVLTASVLNVISIVASIMLLIGITKERIDYIKFWIYIEIVIVVLTLVGSTLLFIFGFHWVAYVGDVIAALLIIYSIVVVRSFASEVESGRSADGFKPPA